MAEQTKKEVIIDVKVQRDERIKELLNQMGSLTKEIVECDLAISKIKKEARSNNAITQEQAKELAKLTAERKTATKQLQSLSREEQNLVVANTAAKNSLNAMRAEISALKVQIADIDVDTPAFAEMAKQIDTITQKVSKAEQSYGVFSRNVGNYKSGFSGLSFQIQQVARELPSLSIGLPQFFLALSNNIPMLTDEITRAKGEIKAAKEAGKEFVPLNKQIIGSIFSVQTAIVAAVTILTVWGDDIIKWAGKVFKGKDAMEAFRKSASAMVGGIAQERAELAGLFNALSKAEQGTANYLAVRNTILDKYGDLLENEREEVKNLTNIAAAYDTITKKITGRAIVEGFNKQIEEQSKKYSEIYSKYFADLLPSFNAKFGEEGISKLIEFLGLLQDGTAESIAKAKEIARVFDTQQMNRQWDSNGEFHDTIVTVNALLDNFGGGSKVDKIVKAFAKITEQINATTEAQQTLLKEFNAEAPASKQDGGSNGNTAFQKAQRALELAQKSAEERLKAERATAYNSEQIYNASEEAKFAFSQKWDSKEFDMEQKHQREMLDLQKRYGEITQEEYNAELAILATQRSTYEQEQLTASAEFAEKMRAQLLKDAEALRKDILKYNEETEKQANKQKWEAYRQSARDLASKGIISTTERDDLITASYASEKVADNSITTKYIRARRSEEQTKGRNIQEILDAQYSKSEVEARQYHGQIAAINLAILKQTQLIVERKKAGLETYEQEAELAYLLQDLQKQRYEDELAVAWRSAAQQYEIRKKYLEEELKLYKGNAAEQARIQQEIAENESQHRHRQLENFQTYTSEIGNLLEGTNELAQTLYDRQLDTEKANNEMALSDLEKRHKAGLISDKQYNNEKLRLDEDLAKKEALIARKQAIMERAMALFNIGVNTASAIMKIWAEVPKADFGISTGVLTALASAAGAAQVAAVLAQPLPKARKGGRIQGATHEAGGVLVNTEDEERIVGADPSRAFPELLNLISYLGKRKMRLPDTGYATRRAQTISPDVLANEVGRQVAVAIDTNNQKQAEAIGRVVGQEVAEQMKNVKIYTAVTDVRKAERLHDRIVNSAKM